VLHATFQVSGVTDLMFGKPVIEKKRDDESHEQSEERLWPKKVWMTDAGQCKLNPFCVTNSLVSAAKWLGRKVDGRSGFTQRFEKGVTPGKDVLLFIKDAGKLIPATMKNVEPILLFVPSTGRRGAGTRVSRVFPTLHNWTATGDCFIWDGKITEKQFEEHLAAVGRFIGWGSMRKEGGGINGCFMVEDISFDEILDVAIPD
jgi:hypothetical protein